MCPDWLWLPGIMGRWKSSLGHVLGAGQLPPAQLFVCLLVYHQQPGLPFHSLDPLHHLGEVGGSGSAASSLDSTWTVAPPKAGRAPGQATGLLGVGGWIKRPAGSTPHPQAPAAPSLLSWGSTLGPRLQELQWVPGPCLSARFSPGGNRKLGVAAVQARMHLCFRVCLSAWVSEREASPWVSIWVCLCPFLSFSVVEYGSLNPCL